MHIILLHRQHLEVGATRELIYSEETEVQKEARITWQGVMIQDWEMGYWLLGSLPSAQEGLVSTLTWFSMATRTIWEMAQCQILVMFAKMGVRGPSESLPTSTWQFTSLPGPALPSSQAACLPLAKSGVVRC
jgi:hypothetical protein